MSMRYTAGFISAFYNPLKNPDAPTIGTATSSSVTFTAPANVGGSAITAYFAIATDSSSGAQFTGTAASSPITVSGLTVGNTYTYRVYAVNSYGPSPLSAASNSTVVIPVIGSVLGGGFFAGQISTAGNGIADYNLIVGPKASTDRPNSPPPFNQFKIANTGGDPTSVIDGPTNSAAMNSATYPAAQFCEGLTVGGFSDWYLPARNELEVCYYNLKPSTANNRTTSGINPNAVPARASNYTTGTPAQTSATAFTNTSGTEFFGSNKYWTSTQASSTEGWAQAFGDGFQYNYIPKTNYSQRIRAIRRIPV